MIRSFAVCGLLLSSALILQAQTAVAPPPPPPAAQDPSLAIAMKFVEDKVKSEAHVLFNVQAEFQGEPMVTRYSIDVNVVAQPETCSFKYKMTTIESVKGASVTRPPQIVEAALDLHSVKKIKVGTWAEFMHDHLANAEDFKVIDTNPDVVILWVNKRQMFPFADQEMADRVAKAMLHSLEVCNPKVKEPY